MGVVAVIFYSYCLILHSPASLIRISSVNSWFLSFRKSWLGPNTACTARAWHEAARLFLLSILRAQSFHSSHNINKRSKLRAALDPQWVLFVHVSCNYKHCMIKWLLILKEAGNGNDSNEMASFRGSFHALAPFRIHVTQKAHVSSCSVM